MAGWMVGLVLGLRTFSQQGLFVVGGALADRYGDTAGGARRLRRCGSPDSAGSGTREETWAVVGAVLLIGFAAALFSPAVESEVARQAVVLGGVGRAARAPVSSRCSPWPDRRARSSDPLLGALLLAWTSVRSASPAPESSYSSSPGTRGCCRSTYPGGAASGSAVASGEAAAQPSLPRAVLRVRRLSARLQPALSRPPRRGGARHGLPGAAGLAVRALLAAGGDGPAACHPLGGGPARPCAGPWWPGCC